MQQAQNMMKIFSRLRVSSFGRLQLNAQSHNKSQVCRAFGANTRHSMPESCRDISVLTSSSGIQVTWADGETSKFHSKWLRHFCQCPSCVQGHSGQRTLNVKEIPLNSKLLSAYVTDEGNIELEWESEKGHLGLLSLQWLRENSYSQSAREQRRRQLFPITFEEDGLPQVAFDEINTIQGQWRFAKQIGDYGISLVKNSPAEEGMVAKIAKRLGPVLYTAYGEIFNVVSTPQPINIAYSSAELPYHMDLMYYESPPGIQLLHVMKFDHVVKGGESMFLDVFPVAEDFRRRFPDEFETLARVPATFQKIHFESLDGARIVNKVSAEETPKKKKDEPVYLKYQRPHIILNHQKEIVGVNWSPAFEGPLSVAEEDVEPYFDAYYKFHAFISESPLTKFCRLEEGDCVAFNNRRILHGRRKFEQNNGTRHLQGCYVNIDEFKRTVDVLSRTVGDGTPCRRVGNQCFF